jgi:hypothetical protein
MDILVRRWQSSGSEKVGSMAGDVMCLEGSEKWVWVFCDGGGSLVSEEVVIFLWFPTKWVWVFCGYVYNVGGSLRGILSFKACLMHLEMRKTNSEEKRDFEGADLALSLVFLISLSGLSDISLWSF